MRGDIEAQRLFLSPQLLLGAPVSDLLAPREHRGSLHFAEETHLIASGLIDTALHQLDHVFNLSDCLGADHVERIEGTTLNQGFQHAPIDELRTNSQTDVGDVLEWAFFFARCDYRLGRFRAHSTDSSHSESNRIVTDGELHPTA